MGWKQSIIAFANRGLGLFGAQLVNARDAKQLAILKEHIDLYQEPRFQVGHATFTSFAHRFNCGWPDHAWCTERTVELAIADRWLDMVRPADVTEVGAVTPYYWPRRVEDVVDPTDPHPQVNRRKSIFDISLVGRAVISISTFEHIGIGDYGLPKSDNLATSALQKLFAESSTFLVTFANRYNAALDEYVMTRADFPSDVELRLLARNPSGIGWVERPAEMKYVQPYSSGRGGSVVILSRGTGLFSGTEHKV